MPDPTPPRAADDARQLEVIDLGRAAYGEVLERMRARHAAVQRGEADGVVWLVEHEPVYTAGRATPTGDLRPGIVPIERGGKITYHGPGQLTVYPLVRLPRRDVRDWLRRLEAFGVRIAARFGLAATPSVDGTGVFVGDRKFASIGVHVKGWVNLHGIGVNIAMDLVGRAGALLSRVGGRTDVEIIECHHRHKEDSPSGTALKFGEIVQAAMGQTKAAHGREGRPGARPADEIGYHAVRAGDNPGEHTILFGMDGESFSVNVRATNRDCYARGALAAARFLVGKPAGLYSMRDVLGMQ